jgi:flagellar hook protein FlgE
MISALSAASSGMNDAMVRVDVVAHNIANVNTAGFLPLQVSSVEMPEGGVAPVVTAGVPGLGTALPPGGSGTDLAAGTVNLILARVAFVASARAFATAARIQHTLALIR